MTNSITQAIIHRLAEREEECPRCKGVGVIEGGSPYEHNYRCSEDGCVEGKVPLIRTKAGRTLRRGCPYDRDTHLEHEVYCYDENGVKRPTQCCQDVGWQDVDEDTALAVGMVWLHEQGWRMLTWVEYEPAVELYKLGHRLIHIRIHDHDVGSAQLEAMEQVVGETPPVASS